MGSKIEDMERLTGFCSHECLAFTSIWWAPHEGLPVVSCALCDLMICALPDYMHLMNKDEYDGLVNN